MDIKRKYRRLERAYNAFYLDLLPIDGGDLRGQVIASYLILLPIDGGDKRGGEEESEEHPPLPNPLPPRERE